VGVGEAMGVFVGIGLGVGEGEEVGATPKVLIACSNDITVALAATIVFWDAIRYLEDPLLARSEFAAV
jgi:hypothetical protein